MSQKHDKSSKIRPRSIAAKMPEEEDETEKDSPEEKIPATARIKLGKTPFPGRGPKKMIPLRKEEKAATPPEAKVESVKEPVEESVKEPVEDAVKTKPPKKNLTWRALFRRVPVYYKKLSRRKVPLLPAGAVLLLLVFLFSWTFSRWSYQRGVANGLQLAEDAATRSKMEVSPEVAKELNEALFQLRKGEVADALKRLQKLEELPHGVASLSYLVALAAMQNGDITLAERKVSETIAKRERISDALALQSVLETQKAADPSMTSMGDPKMRSEALLRQAMIADGANPYPHFELATLLRYQGKTEEAKAEIRAAQARLNPIDSHLVMEVTLAFMEIEETPVGDLPSEVPASADAARLFPAAYSAMRRGDFDLAASLLRRCQDALSIDAFDYLVNDPALRRYVDRPELRPFFGG